MSNTGLSNVLIGVKDYSSTLVSRRHNDVSPARCAVNEPSSRCGQQREALATPLRQRGNGAGTALATRANVPRQPGATVDREVDVDDRTRVEVMGFDPTASTLRT